MDIERHEFNSWNRLKQQIHLEEDDPGYYPKEGEVWMSTLGKNIGREQNGSGHSFSRPILVIRKFNNQIFWCVPLSTKQKNLDFYFNFIDPYGRKASVISVQLKLMSVKRFKRKLYDIDPGKFTTIRRKLQEFLK